MNMRLSTPRSVTGSLVPKGPLNDDPDADIRIGAVLAGMFFIGFLGWASLARLDAAAFAQGQVTVAGHRQTIQQRDGGIVSAVYVKEGQVVRAGDVLIELAGAEVKAQEASLSAQVIAFEAQRARLQAEQLGSATIQWPADFATFTGRDQDDARKAMLVQQTQFSARAADLAAEKGVLRQRALEPMQQAGGYQQQVSALDDQQKLLADELAGVKSLADQGFAPLTQVRALERAAAELRGQRGQDAASIAQAREQAGEARLQALQLDTQRGEDIATQLHDVDFQLNDLTPKLAAARQQLASIEIRAPASGSVVGLSVFTVGGVIAPGQKLMDIVPANAQLVVEAQVSPNDVDDLRVGQTTEVKFTSIHDRGLPIVSGRLTRLSADSLTDEKSGARYFSAEVTVPPAELTALQRTEGPGFALRPGLPVQILVPLKKRTALEYLTAPLTDAVWRTFRER